ncbi:MAG: hypothetical protein KF812_06600 [Fimbriimonadaceae bacterium]|nr:hypothetical protein [Fimbriimonadaceae bacterium]
MEDRARERYKALGVNEALIKKNIENMHREVEIQGQGFTREGTFRVFWLDDIVVVTRIWEKSPTEGQIIEILGPTIYGRFDGTKKIGNGFVRKRAEKSVGGHEMPHAWFGYTIGHEFARSLVAGTPWKRTVGSTEASPEASYAEYSNGTSRFGINFDAKGEPHRMDWMIGLKDTDATLTIDEWTTVEGKRVAKAFSIVRHGAKVTQRFEMQMSSTNPTTVANEWNAVAAIQSVALDARTETDRTFVFGGSIQAVKDLDRQTRQQDNLVVYGIGAVTLFGLGFGAFAVRRGFRPRQAQPKPA